MKITKSINEIETLKSNYKIANKGCKKCPNCGHKNKFPSMISKTWFEGTGFLGFGKGKSMKINCYMCDKCGTEWESDAYQYA